ncbi:sugar-binding transcriptional regulator [Ornithinimicrobium cavernae]|uniref:sugar-binding transcriptional regulator n=1 Tax=Ornithinimicrobium cavernae TaxID=2666047 RepID=UPI000D69202F|nr:sugar-binding domain-containing protein [Ornithinimicrobium cavernae]
MITNTTASERERERTLLLVRVARLYYLDGMDQDQVAREVGFSRPTVSRLLREARRRRIVQIEVQHPQERALQLERELVSRFKLKDARVADPGPGEELMVEDMAASYVTEVTGPTSVVAVSNGSTISRVVDALGNQHRPDMCAVQMIGSLGNESTLVDSPDICRRFATAFGCSYRLMPAPLVVAHARLATALRREDSVATAIALGGRADLALLGVGAIDSTSTSGSIFDTWLTPAINQELRASGAVGHICGHHFDEQGRHLVTELCRRVLSVPPDRLASIPKVVVVAYGPEKVGPLRGSLRGRYANVVITDAETAAAVLDSAT